MIKIPRDFLSYFNFLFLIFLMAPIVVVVLVAFTPEGWLQIPTTKFSLRWFREIPRHPEFIEAFKISLMVAITSSIIATTLGTFAAMALAQHRFPGRDALNSFLLSPLMVPTVVTGISLLYFLSMIGLASTVTAIILGHVIVTIPYVVRTVSASLVGFDQSLERAAMNLGANRVQTFLRIRLPLIAPGITAGGIFAFIMSLDELTVTLFVSGPKLATLPIRIYNHITYITDPLVAAVSTVIVAATFIGVLLLDRLVGLDKAMGA